MSIFGNRVKPPSDSQTAASAPSQTHAPSAPPVLPREVTEWRSKTFDERLDERVREALKPFTPPSAR